MNTRVLCAFALVCASAGQTRAQALDPPVDRGPPFARELRQHYYEQLAKNPWRALGAELIVPGAGNYYVGLYAPAAITLGLSCVGAGLWVAGAIRDRPALTWTGIGTFAAARAYGVVSAPLAAVLLNAAFRRQLGISARY